ncbi:hypothetical protein AB7215_26100, partial [Escherichia coli]
MQKSPLHEEVCVPEETTAGLWGPLPDSHVVLFLDFDGVCHRCKNETLKWSTKTGHRVRVFSSIDFPIRLVV